MGKFFIQILTIVFFMLCSCQTNQSGRSNSKKKLYGILNLDDLKEIANKNVNIDIESSPNIFIVHLDTLRSDHRTKELMPNLSAFASDSIDFANGVAAANATHHSLYAIWYGNLSYKREAQIEAGWKKGSPFIHILKNMGYSPRLYAMQNDYRCPEPGVIVNSYEETNTRLIFGDQASDLIDNCGEQIEKISNNSNADEQIIDKVIADISAGKISKSKPSLNMLFLQGTHYPLSWRSSISKIDVPNEFMISSGVKEEQDFEKIRNSYKNAARSLDIEVGRFIAKLKDEDLYMSSIIVIYSDHGSLLFESNLNGSDKFWYGHGKEGYKQLANVPVSIKVPKKIKVNVNKVSTVDIMPSILDYLEYDLDFYTQQGLIAGQSIFNKSKQDCKINTKPFGEKHPKDLVFIKEKEKAWVELDRDEKNMWRASVQIKKFTDAHDKVIYINSPRVYLEKSFSECLKILIKD